MVKKVKRYIDLMVIHCSATREDRSYSPRQLEADHKARGFNAAGYNYYIQRNGEVVAMRPLELIPAHARGYNRNSIGICYEGGLDRSGKPKDTRTEAQKVALEELLKQLLAVYPDSKIVGHRDLSPDLNGDGTIEAWEWTKMCPCFDAKEEYKHIQAPQPPLGALGAKALLLFLVLMLSSCAARRSAIRSEGQQDIQQSQVKQEHVIGNAWIEELVEKAVSMVEREQTSTTTREVFYSLPDSTGTQHKLAERTQTTTSNRESEVESDESVVKKQREEVKSDSEVSNQLHNQSATKSVEEVKRDTSPPPVAIYMIVGVILSVIVYVVWRRVKRYVPLRVNRS